MRFILWFAAQTVEYPHFWLTFCYVVNIEQILRSLLIGFHVISIRLTI